jgi:hypothetical protein
MVIKIIKTMVMILTIPLAVYCLMALAVILLTVLYAVFKRMVITVAFKERRTPEIVKQVYKKPRSIKHSEDAVKILKQSNSYKNEESVKPDQADVN